MPDITTETQDMTSQDMTSQDMTSQDMTGWGQTNAEQKKITRKQETGNSGGMLALYTGDILLESVCEGVCVCCQQLGTHIHHCGDPDPPQPGKTEL